MTDGELAAMRERCEKATVGRWNPRIASDDIPALLAEVDRLRAELKQAQVREGALMDVLEAAGCPWEVAEQALAAMEGGPGDE